MATAKIIGHRGAAGLELENTLAALQKGVDVGAKILEFDVQITRDGQFVLCHDNHLGRVSDHSVKISDLTYAELQRIPLHNGESVPLLAQALDLARQRHVAVIVEIKIRERLEALCALLDKYKDLDMTVASFKHDAIIAIKKLRPNLRLYLAENTHPIEVVLKAAHLKLQGIDLNYKLLNPLTYLLAKRRNLEIMVYTVDNRLMKTLISRLYPRVKICTNYPDRFTKRRR